MIIKPRRKGGGNHFSPADITSNTVALRSRRDTSGWHISSGGHMPRIRRWRFRSDAANSPAVCLAWLRRTRRYLRQQIDRLFFYTLVNAVPLSLCFCPNAVVREVLLICCCWWCVSGPCLMWPAWAASPSCCWQAFIWWLIWRDGGLDSHFYIQVLFIHSQKALQTVVGQS